VACAAPSASARPSPSRPRRAWPRSRHVTLPSHATVALADALEADGDVDAFLSRWLANPLFATLPVDRAGLEDRRAKSAAGLAGQPPSLLRSARNGGS